MGFMIVLPVEYPTGPIPGVIVIDEALETSQLKVEVLPACILSGFTENELIVGNVRRLLSEFGGCVVGKVVDCVDVPGIALDVVDEFGDVVEVVVDGDVAAAGGLDDDPGAVIVIQPANPKNGIANI